MNLMYTVRQSKKKIHTDSLGRLVGHLPLLNSKVVSIFLALSDTSVQAEVTGERIDRGGGYEQEIPVLYQFYCNENEVNWLKNRLEAILKNVEKDTKHCPKYFN